MIDWNGCRPIPVYRWRLRRRVRKLLEHHPNLFITQTYGGGLHSEGRAVDFGSGDPQNGPERKAMRTCKELWGYNWTELLGPLDWHVFRGTRYEGMYPDHDDHLHCAL